MQVATRAEPGSPGSPSSSARSRLPLSRDRVLRAAIAIADESGLESLTMRRVADGLGAEAMSLYYHVASKEDLLDGMADAVVTEINDAAGAIGCWSARGWSRCSGTAGPGCG
jgi:AcrR family transcriptional regulator